jgi:hypothetical protein
VRLERKLRFDFAKLKAKSKLPTCCRSHYAPLSLHLGEAPAATASDPRLSPARDPPAPRPSGGKREATDSAAAGSWSGTDRADQKRPRRLGNPAEGVPQTPTSSQREGTHATVPSTGGGPGVDDALEYVPHESGDSPARRATPAVADSALVEEVDYLSRQLDQVRDSVSSMRPELARQRYMLDQAERSYHSVFDEVDDLRSRVEWVEDPQSSAQRLATLEEGLRTLGQGMARLEGQLEVLLRFQQQPPVAQPLAAPAPPNPPAPGSGTA